MDKSLFANFKNWFLKLKKSKKYWNSECDILFMNAEKEFKTLLKSNEKKIYLNIDKEVSSKKHDRAIMMKAIRLSKNKNADSKYIDLRFEEMWEEATENEFEPYIGTMMRHILNISDQYERQKIKQKEEETIGGDSLFDKD